MAEKICALMPSFNEALTIGEVVRGLRDRGLPVYVIDDGSEDETASIAREAGATVISHEVNKGKGASLRTGFSHILKEDHDAVLVMDGDGQHRPDDINIFVEKMRQSGAYIIIGNRMADTRRMPLLRFLTNRITSYLISKAGGQYIPDSQCGFRLIKREVLENITIESSNYETESEILIKASKKGFKIASVPIVTIYKGEASQIRPIIDTWRFIVMFCRVA